MNTVSQFIKENNTHQFFNNLTNENYVNLKYPNKDYEQPNLKWMRSIDLRSPQKPPYLQQFDFSKLKGAEPKRPPIGKSRTRQAQAPCVIHEEVPDSADVEIDKNPLYVTDKNVIEAKDHYILTYFENKKVTNLYNGNKPNILVYKTWGDVVAIFKDWYSKDGYKPTDEDVDLSKSSILVSPAFFRDYSRTRKGGDNVIAWNRIALLDIDKHDFTADNLEQSLKDKWGKYSYIVYNTASSSKENPKFRIVLPLNKPVYNEKINQFWHSLNKAFNGLADGQRKDKNGLYYVPAQYPNAYSFFYTNEGQEVNIDLLMDKYPHIEKTRIKPTKPKQVSKQNSDAWYDLYNIGNWANDWKTCPFTDLMRNKIVRYIDLGEPTDKKDGTAKYAMWFNIACEICHKAVKEGLPIQNYKSELVDMMKYIEYLQRGRYSRVDYDWEVQNAIDNAYTK